MKLLTKKQLEDAIKCGDGDINCRKCDMQMDCIVTMGCLTCKKIAQTALAYREMLEEVIKHLSHCPFCKINRPWLYKHKDGCKLAALLKESEVEHDG
jgi:hypothetical protein